MYGAVACVVMASTLTVLASCHQVCFMGSTYDQRSGIPPRWLLPYKDPCKCTALRLGGMMSTPASSYLQGAPYYLDQLILSEDPEEIQALLGCQAECVNPKPLGLEDRTIPDYRITGSSIRYGFPPANGRLNYIGCWSPSSASGADEGSWIEVDLVVSTVVTGVITQGCFSEWRTTQYKVAYKKQSSPVYAYVTHANGTPKVFDGNLADATTPVTNIFHRSIVATAVRIEPVAWFITESGQGGAAMRLELLGCRTY